MIENSDCNGTGSVYDRLLVSQNITMMTDMSVTLQALSFSCVEELAKHVSHLQLLEDRIHLLVERARFKSEQDSAAEQTSPAAGRDDSSMSKDEVHTSFSVRSPSKDLKGRILQTQIEGDPGTGTHTPSSDDSRD